MELIPDDEIDKISCDVWSRILSPSKPHVVTPGNSIRVQNPDTHHQYSAVHLNLFEKTEKKSASNTSEEDEEDDDAGERFDMPASVRIKPSEFYAQFVARTPEQCEEELKAPQKSEQWLQARKYSITASQFGSAVGTSPYQSPDALVIDKLWNTFTGNAATQWGNEHEHHAKETFCQWFSQHINVPFRFIEENLMKFSDEPWMAVSPDGIVQYEMDGQLCEDLVEFKCPAYYRNAVNHPYAKYTKQTPPHYMSQMQGIMGYLNAHGRHFKNAGLWCGNPTRPGSSRMTLTRVITMTCTQNYASGISANFYQRLLTKRMVYFVLARAYRKKSLKFLRWCKLKTNVVSNNVKLGSSRITYCSSRWNGTHFKTRRQVIAASAAVPHGVRRFRATWYFAGRFAHKIIQREQDRLAYVSDRVFCRHSCRPRAVRHRLFWSRVVQ
jgi:putative phage-type endonuclease